MTEVTRRQGGALIRRLELLRELHAVAEIKAGYVRNLNEHVSKHRIGAGFVAILKEVGFVTEIHRGKYKWNMTTEPNMGHVKQAYALEKKRDAAYVSTHTVKAKEQLPIPFTNSKAEVHTIVELCRMAVTYDIPQNQWEQFVNSVYDKTTRHGTQQ